jgi:hypothetical protein
VLPLADERPDGIGEWLPSALCHPGELTHFQMDQVPYPGPDALFHVRMVVLFIVLATVDVVALGVAMNTIFTEGVGGTVLFANEVSPERTPPSPTANKASVRDFVGQRLELHHQVLPQHYRVPPRT